MRYLSSLEVEAVSGGIFMYQDSGVMDGMATGFDSSRYGVMMLEVGQTKMGDDSGYAGVTTGSSFTPSKSGSNCKETVTVKTESSFTTVTVSPGCVFTSSPPFISCSLGTPTTTTTTTGGVSRVITCTEP